MTATRGRLLVVAAVALGGGLAVVAYAGRPEGLHGPGIGHFQTGDFGLSYRVDDATRDASQLTVTITVRNPAADDLSAIMDDAKVIADDRQYDPDQGLAPTLDLQPLQSRSVKLHYTVPSDAASVYVRLRGGVKFDVTS